MHWPHPSLIVLLRMPLRGLQAGAVLIVFLFAWFVPHRRVPMGFLTRRLMPGALFLLIFILIIATLCALGLSRILLISLSMIGIIRRVRVALSRPHLRARCSSASLVCVPRRLMRVMVPPIVILSLILTLLLVPLLIMTLVFVH